MQSSGSATSNSTNLAVGGLFTFGSSVVSSRVGISWISNEKACQNLDDEIPAETTFKTVVENTKDAWNSQVLSTITTTSTNATNLELLYTSLYFMNLLPTNQTGENPGWNSSEPYYSDIFTLWDLFRCSTALLHVLQPTVYEEHIRSMIDIWRFDGYMPDARSSNYNGRTQGGSNADNVLADAYIKGVRGQVNWDDGYAAMVKDAEVTPPNTIPPDPQAPDSSTKEGRGALPDWLTYGFITPTSVARNPAQLNTLTMTFHSIRSRKVLVRQQILRSISVAQETGETTGTQISSPSDFPVSYNLGTSPASLIRIP